MKDEENLETGILPDSAATPVTHQEIAIVRLLDSAFGIDPKLSFWERMAVTAFAIGTLTIAAYATPTDWGWWQRSSTIFGIALGAWMAGASLGFLFGVPKYKSDPAASNLNITSPAAQAAMAFTPNTNLEQISDWLTKIIVGATLVQIGPLIAQFVALMIWAGQQVAMPGAALFTGGVTVFFFCSGFMWGYLWCSIRIFQEMVKLTSRIQEAGSGGSGL